jgi:lipid-A-disaccharide synthase
MLRVMVSCGEPSGDVYAAALARAMREREPALDVFGFGGPACRAAGVRLVGDYTGLAVTGLTEVVRVLPATFAMLRRLADAAAETRPDALVLVDYPDFNFQLMKRLAPRGIPVVYYVTPQLWAWRAGRMKTMQRHVTLALPIFPFEEALYRDAGVPVRFLGHPLVDSVPEPSSDAAGAAAHQQALRRGLGLEPARPTVALLPGSRRAEIRYIAPPFLRSAARLHRERPALRFVLPLAPGLRSLLEPLQAAHAPGVPIQLVDGQSHAVLAACDVTLIASGTATLEAALFKRPMVIGYDLHPLSWQIMKRMRYQPWVGLPNILAREFLVPELLHDDCRPERLVPAVLAWLDDARACERLAARFAELHHLLRRDTARRASDAIAQVLQARAARA